MRDVKFRVWDKSKSAMFTKVVVGNVTSADSENYTAHAYYDDGWLHFDELSDEVALMQFTGLKDKNGIDIYEGDICYVEGHGNCLVYICKYYGVSFDDYNGHHIAAIDCDAETDLYNIVGNIHENPELMEK